MINITKEELKKLEKIGNGSFGTVYRVGDVAYKIYYNYVFDSNDNIFYDMYSPKNENRLKKIIKRNYNLKYTSIATDIIYIDGSFGGVVIPYYEGCILDNLMKEDINLKLQIVDKLVRNAEELTNNNIYPRDYKLNNIIYDGDVRIIDLDDYRTCYSRVFNPLNLKSSTIKLEETIKEFLEYGNTVYSYYYGRKYLDRTSYIKCRGYSDIKKYIEDKKEYKKFAIIADALLDDEMIYNLSRYKDYKFIIVNYRNKDLKDIINKMKKVGLSVYDVLSEGSLSYYFNFFNVEDIEQIGCEYVKL